MDFVLIPFSLVWSGFVFFAGFAALVSVKRGTNDWTALVSIIPFVLAGLYILVGRFFIDAITRAKTEYAVTNRRAIIVSGLFSRSVKSIDLRSTSEIALNERGDKSGTITFGATPFGWWMRSNPWGFGSSSATPSFEMIEDVRSVYKTIEQVRTTQTAS